MKISFSLFCVLLFLAMVVGQTRHAKHAKPKIALKDTVKIHETKPIPVSYGKDIVPILNRYCLPCHTEDDMNPSELYLDTYDGMMKGGRHGPNITPGKADSSNLIRKISFDPPFGKVMPLKRTTAFPQDTLMILKRWIDEGAKNN